MVLADHRADFVAVERHTARTHLTLTRDTLVQLLAATYRGQRFSNSPAIEHLDRLDVTLSSDVVVFSPVTAD